MKIQTQIYGICLLYDNLELGGVFKWIFLWSFSNVYNKSTFFLEKKWIIEYLGNTAHHGTTLFKSKYICPSVFGLRLTRRWAMEGHKLAKNGDKGLSSFFFGLLLCGLGWKYSLPFSAESPLCFPVESPHLFKDIPFIFLFFSLKKSVWDDGNIFILLPPFLVVFPLLLFLLLFLHGDVETESWFGFRGWNDPIQ